MKRQQRTQLYQRNGRWYADLRAFVDVGGKQEAMMPKGEKRATTDPSTALVLMAERVTQLEAARKGRTLAGLARVVTRKSEARKVEADWIGKLEVFLGRAAEYLGAGRSLHTVTVVECQQWATHLADEGLTAGSVRHHLNALSNLYRRAQSEGVVPSGFNPVGSMLEKPTGARAEATWLEVSDASLLLESARTLTPSPEGGPRSSYTYGYPLIATFLLTGGRESEILGLEVADVSFDRQTITFRPNQWRRLKTKGSARVLRLWPQLGEILQPYVDRRVIERGGTLLFPAEDPHKMVTDWRKLLDRVAQRAGWKAGEIRSKMFRHSYCATRLQTLDGGAPVAVYSVSRELGHSSTAMVERVYSHMGTIRHRSEQVEYRVEQHAERLGDRLTALRTPAMA
jgi:integrase